MDWPIIDLRRFYDMLNRSKPRYFGKVIDSRDYRIGDKVLICLDDHVYQYKYGTVTGIRPRTAEIRVQVPGKDVQCWFGVEALQKI